MNELIISYEFEIVKREKTCSFCNKNMQKGEKHFIQLIWNNIQNYPKKQNICLDCCKQITEDNFMNTLRALYHGLKVLQGSLE